jgi:hypothetical protein
MDFKEMATAWALPENHCDTTLDTDWSGAESNSKTKFEQLHIVLGVVNDKEEILLFQRMLFTTSQSQIIQED